MPRLETNDYSDNGPITIKDDSESDFEEIQAGIVASFHICGRTI